MAVYAGIYGKEDVAEYEGCVLRTYERNGYDDSDWYAVCWDNEKQAVVDVMYDTTRAGGGGSAVVDATEDVLRKAYRYYRNLGRSLYDHQTNPGNAKKIHTGDTVTVIRGRKIKKGSTGQVFWVGTRYNAYRYCNEERVGVEIDGERVFLPTDYVEVVGWDGRLVTGAERKKAIRNFALNSMPNWAIRYLTGRIKEGKHEKSND